MKVHVKKDDLVQIVSGKEKGKRGKIIKVFPKKNRVLVEKINYIKRHTRPTQQQQEGGIIEKEGSIYASNVMLVCNKCDKPVKYKKKLLEDDKKVRICVKCNEVL